MGWRKLATSHRKAAIWLVLGMLLFALRWVLGALSTAYSAALRDQLGEGSVEVTDLASILARNILALHLILALSLLCIWAAAVADRGVRSAGSSTT
jgi:hypothetical protein